MAAAAPAVGWALPVSTTTGCRSCTGVPSLLNCAQVDRFFSQGVLSDHTDLPLALGIMVGPDTFDLVLNRGKSD